MRQRRTRSTPRAMSVQNPTHSAPQDEAVFGSAACRPEVHGRACPSPTTPSPVALAEAPQGVPSTLAPPRRPWRDPAAASAERRARPARLPLGATVQSRRLARPLLAALALALSTAVLPSAALAAEPCPNEARRAEDPYSQTLPDCRAYEQVSPVDKQDGVVAGSGDESAAGVAQEPVVRTSRSGNTVSYVESRSSSGNGSSFGNQYKAARTAEGWAVEDLSPTYTYGATPEFAAFSPDLASAVVESEVGLPGVESATPQGYAEMYVRGATGEYTPLNLTTPPNREAFGGISGGHEFIVELLGTGADLSHVVFSANDALTPATTFAPAARDPGRNGRNVYEWSDGHLSLVNVLPGNSTTDPTGIAAQGNIHAVSTDGSRVFWTDATTGDLYLREDGERTIQIDASQGPGEGGGGHFRAASASGAVVFFTDENRLTSDSTAASGEPDLYEYNVEDGGLTDLTVAEGGGHAGVQGLLASSEDGSYLYFAADGVLAPGASPGDCTTGPLYGQECNLYVWHAGAATKFIARLSGADGGPATIAGAARLSSPEWGDWSTQLGLRTAQATPDGQYLAFMSVNRLTAYDNRDAHGLTAMNSGTGGKDFEVYVYDSETGALRCASCDPTGARPVGHSVLPPAGFVHGYALTYQPNWLSEDGSRLFFDSRDALSAQAVGGVTNVYEYEAGGVYLISAGTTQNGAYFDAASPSGGDVFFTTGARLVGQDMDEQPDLYDARVDGGIAAQNPTVSTPCSDEACRGAAGGAPAPGVPVSQVFSGPGNLAPPVEPVVATKVAARVLTRAQELSQALKACRRDRKKSRRVACERSARKRYGAKVKATRSKR